MKKVKIHLNIKKLLHTTQRFVFKHLARFNVIVAGRRWGKSRLACFVIFFRALQRPGVYWWISPSNKINTPAWRLLKRLVKATFKEENAIIIRETTRIIELPNGSYIEFKSADDPDSLRGEGLRGVVLDEVAQMKWAEVWEAIRPALTDFKGWAIIIGTPKRSPFFRELYEKGKKDGKVWKSFHYTSYDNELIDADELEDAKSQMSTKQFEQEHLAQFVSDEGNIFKMEWFDRMSLDKAKPIASFISWDTASVTNKDAAYSAGVVGWLLDDYRVFIRKVIRKKLEFTDLEYAVEELARQEINRNLGAIVIEFKSSGIAVAQSLKATSIYSHLVVPFNPKGSKEERAEKAAKWCEKGMVVLPLYEGETKEELENIAWLPDFEEELADFPNGIYRDQTDAFSQLIEYMSNYFQHRLTRLGGGK